MEKEELKTKWKLFFVEGFKHKIVIHPNADKTDWADWVITNEHTNTVIAKGEM